MKTNRRVGCAVKFGPRRRAGHLEHDVVCRPEFAVANPFDVLECAALGLRLGKKTVADMFRTAAAINDTAVLARAYMGYVESVRRVEPRLLAEIDIFACRGRVGGKEVVFKVRRRSLQGLVGRRGRRGTRRQES